MPRINLTDRFVAGAKPGASGRREYFDSVTPGLTLRVSAAGVKSWSFFFSSPKSGERARVTLGRYPAMSLAKARGLALEAKGQIDDAHDPRNLFAAKDANAFTVQMLINSFLEKHVRPNLRTAANFEQRFRRNVTPIIGAERLSDLHRRNFNAVLDPIIRRGSPVEANLVFSQLHSMFVWAVKRGDLDSNPMQGMGKPGAVPSPRERCLSDDEIKQVWNALPTALARSVACQRILKLCLVLGQRIGEISGMRCDELDLEKNIWRLPPSRVKNATAHTVPLSGLAIDIIKEALKDAGKNAQFVFPSPVTGENAEDSEKKTINPHAVGRTLLRAHQATKEWPEGKFAMQVWTPHDLRRTTLTHMAALGIQPIVIASCANHLSVTRAGVTFSSYVRHNYAEEKREALDLWAARLSAIIEGDAATVIPMRRGNASPA